MPNVQEIPRLRLNDGVHIAQLGFGVFQVAPEDTARAVTEALEAGYRHIDTAAAYRNEKGVGRAIAASGLARDEVFVTTKLWNGDHGHETALRAFDQSLGRLGLDHVDLYLIHWPLPSRDRYVETWKAFEAIKSDGRARSIGVSNFQPDHLERLAAEGWSPLAQGGDLLEDPVITEIAEQRDKTPAQVVLRWHVQIGNVVIPK